MDRSPLSTRTRPEGERQLHLSLAAARAGTWVWDVETGENDWSDEVWALYDLDRSSVPPSFEGWLASVRPEDRESLSAYVAETSAVGGELDFEWRVATRDGSPRWVHSHGSPELERGHVVRYRGVVMDVTRGREAEEELRRTLESVGDGFVAVDADWRFVYVNPVAERMLDLARDEVLGMDFWEVFAPALGTHLEEEYRRAAAGEPVEFENLYEPWGRWFHNRCFPREGGGISIYVTDITERKAADLALRESEESYAAVFNEAPFGILVSRMPSSEIVSANRAFLDLFECTLADIVGKTIPEVGIAAPEAIAAMAAELRAGGVVRDRDVARHTLGGREVLLTINLSLVTIAGESHVLTAIRDVTEARAADRALQESRAKLEAALASMTDGVYISDAGGNLVDVNDAFARINRFPSKAACLETFADYPFLFEVYLDGRPAPAEMWAIPRALGGEARSDVEYGIRRKDTGEYWDASYSFSPIRNEAGEIAGAVFVERDISERKRIERALLESEERFRLLFEHSPIGVFFTSPDGSVTAANRAACEMFGYDEPELIALGRTGVFDSGDGGFGGRCPSAPRSAGSREWNSRRSATAGSDSRSRSTPSSCPRILPARS